MVAWWSALVIAVCVTEGVGLGTRHVQDHPSEFAMSVAVSASSWSIAVECPVLGRLWCSGRSLTRFVCKRACLRKQSDGTVSGIGHCRQLGYPPGMPGPRPAEGVSQVSSLWSGFT